MSKYIHDSWGSIADCIFAKGVITAVDSDNDLADVTVEGYQNGQNVPLYYHCDNEAEERSNGAIEGAAAGFSADDEVIVMCDAQGKPIRIVGFVDGIRSCCGTIFFSSMSDDGTKYYAAWNMGSQQVLLNVTSNPAEYEGIIPDPFVNQESCPDIDSLYDRISVGRGIGALQLVSSYTGDEFEESITCEGYTHNSGTMYGSWGSSFASPAYDNLFGHNMRTYQFDSTMSCDPYCDGAEAYWNCTTSTTTVSQQELNWGYRYTKRNGEGGNIDVHVNETAHQVDNVGPINVLISDPTGSCASSPSVWGGYSFHHIMGGFYPVDGEGNPASGNVMSWYVREFNGSYAATASQNGSTKSELSSLLKSLCESSGKLSFSYVRG